MEQIITLRHGDGGRQTSRLINDIFYRYFENSAPNGCLDAALLNIKENRLAFTTDSFVVKPLFFTGGDIGKLSVCGTVNDLTAAGAVPRFLSAGFIIEEGFELAKLDAIAASMREMCNKTGTKIVTGDTKVVEKGLVDGVFINTAGIGAVHADFSPQTIKSGDAVILTGSIAEHGTVILAERSAMDLHGDFKSDCAPLSEIIPALGSLLRHVRLMRDPTRGGVATALCELSDSAGIGAVIEEERLLIREPVAALHHMLGTDPLYFASEGRMLLVIAQGYENAVLSQLKTLPTCKNSAIIGTFNHTRDRIWLRTPLGGERLLGMLENHTVSRIC